MKVLLAQPPLQPGGEVVAPLGLCTLASWLLHLGHEIRIIDLDLELKSGSHHSPQLYLELFLRELKSFQPEVVGVTSMYSNSLQAERLIRSAKQYRLGLVTVAGGSHFGALGACSLRRIPELDYVVEGEGELPIAALLDALSSKTPVNEIPGLCYRNDGEVITNPRGKLIDLADVPQMWVSLDGCLDISRYAKTIPASNTHKAIYIEAGRGCPFACSFCATAPFWQRKYRVKPVHRLVDEIRFLHEHFGYDRFALVHDLLTVDQRFMSEFSDAMLAARLPVDWMANSRTDIRLHGILPKMKAAGCWKLFYGIESASERMQKSFNKNLDLSEAVSTIKELRDHGITAVTSFVIGFPTESLSELSQTIAMAARFKLLGVENVQLHRLRLWPPAPLSRSDLPAEFDLDSLRIEYPFINVPAEDVAEIKGDKEFFEGYFAPRSNAGSFSQLAQVEMFFHHAIAVAPFTIFTMAFFAKDALVSSFYEALEDAGGLSREEFEWEATNLYGNWQALYPLLVRWLAKQRALEEWQRALVQGVLDYETRRLQFVSGERVAYDSALTSGPNWVAFSTSVDIAQLLERIDAGAELTDDLLLPELIVLARRGDASFAAYKVDAPLLPALLHHQPEIVRAFEN